VDDCCNTDSSVAAGVGEQLHHGRSYSHLAGHCYNRCAGQRHSGATRVVKQSSCPNKDEESCHNQQSKRWKSGRVILSEVPCETGSSKTNLQLKNCG
jgi:hypothetical protein